MISYLRGRLLQVVEGSIILETGGIGWLVHTPAGQTWPQPGTEVAVYTHLVVRENAMELYGFTRPEGLRLFNLLLGVTGIGPRGAIQMMAAASPENLARAIATEDTAFLTGLPGIGVKKAQRLILELKDKILNSNLVGDARLDGDVVVSVEYDEALAALTALGYNQGEISPYLDRVRVELGPEVDTTTVLQAVLKSLGREEGNS